MNEGKMEYDIVVPMERYDDLVRTEAKYQTITKAISRAYSYNDIAAIVNIFGLKHKEIMEDKE